MFWVNVNCKIVNVRYYVFCAYLNNSKKFKPQYSIQVVSFTAGGRQCYTPTL